MSPPEQGYEDATIPPPSFLQYNTPPALIAFTFALLVLCFVTFSAIYLCKYCLVSLLQSWALQSTSGGGSSLVRLSPNNRSSFDPLSGLDPSLLHMFPTFLYSSVKDLRMENKYGLECAVCLLEFEDNSMLRHLTACCHVFHQECIDLWLLSHKTCPVCRTHLDSPSIYTPKSGVAEAGESTVLVDLRIDITREGGLGDIGGDSTTVGDQRQQHHDHEIDNDQEVSVSVSVQQHQQQHVFKRSRSHSTGHSVVLIRGDDDEDKKDHDRYTLRLPEHVIIRGNHNYSKSCASYQEMQMNNRPLVAADPCSCTNCVFVESVSGCSNSLNHTQKNLKNSCSPI